MSFDPPRYGEGDHRTGDGGGGAPRAPHPASRPLHHQPEAGGLPPRAGEDRVGRLLGIGRKARKYALLQSLPEARITVEEGVAGDYLGIFKPMGRNRRQVTIFTREDWETALRELGAEADWTARRCNLFVEGIVLPRESDAVIRIGADALLLITGECDPCKRMDAVAEGLFPALRPDWRGGRLMRVVAPGAIAIGDVVRIEETA